jgi:hypothetical protein
MNKIELLERADGSVCSNTDEVHAEVQEFYQALYTSQGSGNMDELLNLVQPVVSGQMNETMDRVYTEDEVKLALFQMAPSKAPGVDGFTAGFFQRHWDLLKQDIVQAFLDFLNGGVLPTGMNDTSITLIPKVKHPQKIPNIDLSPFALSFIRLGPNALQIDSVVFLGILLGKNKVLLFLAVSLQIMFLLCMKVFMW